MEKYVCNVTREEVEKICNFMYEKYGEIDENNIPTADTDDICKHCPFSTVSVDSADGDDIIHYHCFRSNLFSKINDKDLLDYLYPPKA